MNKGAMFVNKDTVFVNKAASHQPSAIRRMG
jgi:hypothetical protein